MMDDLTHIEKLIRLEQVANWDSTCEWAEEFCPPVKRHMETWGPHCGAPRDVYLGHLVRMLVNMGSPPKRGAS